MFVGQRQHAIPDPAIKYTVSMQRYHLFNIILLFILAFIWSLECKKIVQILFIFTTTWSWEKQKIIFKKLENEMFGLCAQKKHEWLIHSLSIDL